MKIQQLIDTKNWKSIDPFTIKSKLSFLFLIVFLTCHSNAYSQCASNATSTSDEDIINVTFGTLNNTSSCSTTGGTGSILNEYSNYAYAGFPGGVPNIDKGCTIPFSVQVGTCGGNYSNAVAIYIDWNNDGDFLDAGENVYLSATTTSGPHTETGNITVPATALLGNCKMRVICSETSPGSISPCGIYSWGETEDYYVNITNGGGVASYVSSNTTQLVSGSVSQCATLQQIICIPVVMGAGCTAGNLTQFQLGAGSSTNLPADVTKIHVFYTGTSSVYIATNEFVSGGTVPTGATNTINGSQTLVPNATNYFWVTYDMNPTSTLGNIIDGSCTQITVGGSNQAPITTNPVGSGTIVSCPCSFSLGSDVTLCAPFTYTLNGPAGFDTYTWTPGNAHTQNLVVNTAGSYTCSATLINGGLVTNGDFNSGNTGFTTSYVLGTGGTWGALSNPGTYSVTTNPSLAHNNFYSFGDHTTGTGKMLVCNGSDIANTVVWSQTITVTPNTMYNFSAWVASVENTTAEAQLQFSINGNLIGPVVSAPATGGTWLNFFVNWNSGSSSSAIIKIVDQSTEPSGNDFALDDITFERVCTFSDVITINAGSTCTVSVPTNINVCNSGTVAASSYTSSTASVTYSWTNSNPSIGLAASGTSNTPVFTAINTGTAPVTAIISVTPAVGTCTGTPKSYTITVNPTPSITVNSPTICAGVSTTLTASGATGYSWNSGAATSTLNVSPVSQTIYTVTGTSLGCSSSATSTVYINSGLSISVNNPTICAGASTVLTAGGATNYTWSTGAMTSTVSVTPTATTVYTVTGNTSGCTGSNTATVTINALPTLTVNNPTICAGASTVLTTTGATSYSWNTGVSAQTISVSPTVTTIYTVTGTSNGCSNTNTATVTVNAIPTLTVNNPSTCSGVPVTLSATGATSYSWSTGATTQTVSVAPTVNTIYTVTGISNGCSSTTTSTVSINSALSVSINSATICAGASTVLTAVGATNYTWSTGATSSTVNVSPLSTVVYSVTGETSGCVGTGSATVTVNSIPAITVNNATICSGASTVLTVGGATSYTWNTGITTASINVSPTSNTVYTVTGETLGCSSSNSATVTVNSLPTISVGNSVICSGNSATLTANGASSYTWMPGAIVGSSINVTPGATTIYTVTGTDGFCTNVGTGTVTVNSCSSPCTFTLANDIALCSPLNYTVNGPAGYNSYSWTPGGATTQNLVVTTPGTYTCTANVYSNDLVVNGNFSGGNTNFSTNYSLGTGGTWGPLSNPGTYSITNNPSSAHNNFYSFGDHTTGNGNMLVCNGSAIANDVAWTQTINVTPNTNYNFSAWVASVENTSAGSEALLQFAINGSLIGTVTNAPLTGGIWSNFFVNWNSGANTSAIITIVDQNTSGGANDFALDDIYFQQVCSHSDEITITENQTPNLTVTATNSVVCFGNQSMLTASGASTYTWTGGIANGSVFTPTVTATYTVTGTSAVGGCTSTAVKTITVNSVPTLTVTNAIICSGETASLSASPSISGGTYTWSPGNQSSSNVSVTPSSTSSYSVTYSVNGCSTTATSTVNVNATPTVSVSSVSICEGQTATLTATPSITGGTYLWPQTMQTNQSIADSPLINTVYGVLYSVNGCTAIASGSITVNANPTLTLSSSASTINPLDNAIITATGSVGTYIWTTGEANMSIMVNPQNTTTYCATVTTTAGCKNSACVDVIVIDESTLYIPNVFTPNGDGVNDIYYTPNRNIVKYNMDIFNRWGQLLFSSEDPLKGWDGTFNGQMVPDGVYVFILKATGADKAVYNKTGHITILK